MKNGWTITGIVAIVFLVLLLCVGGTIVLTMGRLGARGVGMMGRFGSYGMASSFHPLAWMIPLGVGLLAVIGIIALVVWLVRKQTTGTESSASPTILATPSPESALEIIKARYAKGEITKEQFDAMKLDLS